MPQFVNHNGPKDKDTIFTRQIEKSKIFNAERLVQIEQIYLIEKISRTWLLSFTAKKLLLCRILQQSVERIKTYITTFGYIQDIYQGFH